MDNVMWNFSTILYNGLSDIIGTSEVVKMRREIADLLDHAYNSLDHSLNLTVIRSGSNREGFRFSESDIDVMAWRTATKAVCFLPQPQYYYATATEGLVLMESCDSHPGFALLQVLSSSFFDQYRWLCINIADKFYVSSSNFKLFIHAALEGHYDIHCNPHGPCATGIHDDKEFDIAICFQCDDWPPQAYSFLNRCSSHLWPSPYVLKDILDGGCHFVPVGAKDSANENHQWRVSFSVAEQKLVYSLSHSQFLCYGLLKLFLKEVISKEIPNHQLCSYFLKTALFWEIQNGCINIWCAQNILFCFWKCFKRLIKWVYQGVCPNFFISSNNMFGGKIYGLSQQQLFHDLYSLYELGFFSLLKSKSLNSILNSRNCLFDFNKEFTLSQSFIQSQLIHELTSYPLLAFYFSCVHENDLLEVIPQLSTGNLSSYQKIAIEVYEKIAIKELLLWPKEWTEYQTTALVRNLFKKYYKNCSP